MFVKPFRNATFCRYLKFKTNLLSDLSLTELMKEYEAGQQRNVEDREAILERKASEIERMKDEGSGSGSGSEERKEEENREEGNKEEEQQGEENKEKPVRKVFYG